MFKVDRVGQDFAHARTGALRQFLATQPKEIHLHLGQRGVDTIVEPGDFAAGLRIVDQQGSQVELHHQGDIVADPQDLAHSAAKRQCGRVERRVVKIGRRALLGIRVRPDLPRDALERTQQRQEKQQQDGIEAQVRNDGDTPHRRQKVRQQRPGEASRDQRDQRAGSPYGEVPVDEPSCLGSFRGHGKAGQHSAAQVGTGHQRHHQ